MNKNLVLTAQEAAKALRESPKTTLDKLESGEIPAYREGTHWKVPVKLLERYIENKALTETKERRTIYNKMVEEEK